jgi:hypothetical protein
MKRARMPRIMFVAIAALTALPASATGVLTYDGPGYGIEIEVGEDTTSLIAAVKVSPPHGSSVVMTPGTCTTVAFNASRQTLELRCPGQGPFIEPFTLSVEHERATLRVGRRVYRWSEFQWVL